MYLSAIEIVRESKNIVEMASQRDVCAAPLHREDLRNALLEVYRQTQTFLNNAERVDRLIGIFDERTARAVRKLYGYDISVYIHLDQLVDALYDNVQMSGRVIDFNPFNYDPTGIDAISKTRWQSSLDPIKNMKGIKTGTIQKKPTVSKLLARSEARIANIEKGTRQLARFIARQFSMRDFIEMSDVDFGMLRYERQREQFKLDARE